MDDPPLPKLMLTKAEELALNIGSHIFHHRREIENSDLCGCYSCRRVFTPAAIQFWVDDGDTATCPYCSVDYVFGSASGYPISSEFLQEVYDILVAPHMQRRKRTRRMPSGNEPYAKDAIKAHPHSGLNREEIEQSTLCGCFFCISIFPPAEIERWLRMIAVCPYCSTDAVIGSASGYPITKEFLQQMRDIWFAEP